MNISTKKFYNICKTQNIIKKKIPLSSRKRTTKIKQKKHFCSRVTNKNNLLSNTKAH